MVKYVWEVIIVNGDIYGNFYMYVSLEFFFLFVRNPFIESTYPTVPPLA